MDSPPDRMDEVNLPQADDRLVRDHLREPPVRGYLLEGIAAFSHLDFCLLDRLLDLLGQQIDGRLRVLDLRLGVGLLALLLLRLELARVAIVLSEVIELDLILLLLQELSDLP